MDFEGTGQRIDVVGIPFASVYPPNPEKPNLEVRKSPDALRSYFSVRPPKGYENWVDHGDVTIVPDDRRMTPDLAEPVMREVHREVNSVLGMRGDFLILLGGECYITVGTLPAIVERYPDIHVIWLDAHADLLTERTTTTKFLDGMSLARVMGWAGQQPAILLREQVTLLSAQNAEPGEAAILCDRMVRHVHPDDVLRWIEEDMPAGDLFFHIDMDAVDPVDMPSVDFPISPGFSQEALKAMVATVAHTGRLRGVQIACYNPALDPLRKGAELIASLLSIATTGSS